VVTRYNIKGLTHFVKTIAEYGKGKISITLQPYHHPPSISEISHEVDQEMKKRLYLCYQKRVHEYLAPNIELKPILQEEIEELIRLKREGIPLVNSEIYLKMIPNFLFNNELPKGFHCTAGYTGVFIRYDLKVLPCYRLPPVGDLRKKNLVDIWLSETYRKERKKMKSLICHGCMFLCYSDPGWSSSRMTWEFYNYVYRSSNFLLKR
jgi:MoaA/NifB/PqqE/SkfB family radical SAM enzyme